MKKRISSLLAVGVLVAGLAGAAPKAQAHTSLFVNLGLEAPAPVYYAPPPPVVYAPVPVVYDYYGHPVYARNVDYRYYGHDPYYWDHRGYRNWR